jgi:superfamily I DNA/RNA helicase
MKLKPTSEQTAILESVASGRNIAIQALAGTGKTSTLQMIAEKDSVPTLYVAFNRSIAEEASTKFPKNVTCKTIHSLAYAAFGKLFQRGTIIGWYDVAKTRELLKHRLPDKQEDADKLCYLVIEYVKGFCHSSSENLEVYFQEVAEEHQCLLPDVRVLWDNISNPAKAVYSTHDVYLKLYQLSKPKLNFQRVMLDEAQDTNAVSLSIFLRQSSHAQLIAVGDSCQSIYGWRGSKNFFSHIPESWDNLLLSESFRFGESVANIANLCLANFNRKVIGRGADWDRESKFPQETILVRNNLTLWSALMRAADSNTPVYCYTDLKEVFGKLYHAGEMYYSSLQGRKPEVRYPDKQLSSFKSWKELEESSDAEIVRLVKLTKASMPIHQTVTKIKSILVKDESQAKLVLSTGHKSKGLEWDCVSINDDFLPSGKEWEGLSESQRWKYLEDSQTIQLLYVAITRAKKRVILSEDMVMFLGTLTEYKPK